MTVCNYLLCCLQIKPFGLPVPDIVQAIANLRSAVGGGKEQGLFKSKGSKKVVVLAPADKDAIAFSRSTSEVLKIVYLGGTEKGGFFPDVSMDMRLILGASLQ